MARTEYEDYQGTVGQQGWGALINDFLTALQDNPTAVARFANVAALPAAASHENCLAFTEDEDLLWMSDGSAWRTVGGGVLNMNGARAGHRMATAVIDVAVSPTAAGLYPAGCIRKGVSGRNLTGFVMGGGGTAFNIGDGSDADRYKANMGLTSGLTFTPADITAASLEQLAAAGDVTLTPVSGSFTSGTMRVVVSYEELTAPTA